MNILFTPLLLVAFISNLFFTSKLAQVLNAERHQMIWVFMTWLVGSLLTLGFALLKLDIPIVLICMLIIFTFLYNVIVGIDMGGAIIVNIASLTVIVLLIALTFKFFGQEYIPTIKNHIAQLDFASTFVNDDKTKNQDKAQDLQSSINRPAFSNQSQSFDYPNDYHDTYNRVSIDRAYQFKGKSVRIRKTDSTTIQGTLVNTTRDSIVILFPENNGLAERQAPINKLAIHRLEAQY